MIKKIICFILAAACCLSLSLTVCAESGAYISAERILPRFNDEANLLSQAQADSLSEKLDIMSESISFDIVIVTVYSTGIKSPESFSYDYFDYNGFGYGENADGVLLLVSMAERDWYISTSGYGQTAINDDGLKYISDKVVPYLSDGDYSTAFDVFAELCEDFVIQANTAEPYTSATLPKEKLSLMWIPGSILIGMFISFMIMLGFKSQLKSVRRKPAARDYQVPDSMRVTEQSDMYLYSHVSRTPRQTQTSSKGGTHVGSSGRSHGGRGGKF